MSLLWSGLKSDSPAPPPTSRSAFLPRTTSTPSSPTVTTLSQLALLTASSSSSLSTSPWPRKVAKSSAMVEPIFDYQFRVILIGDSTVGKSSLLRCFTDGTFAELSDPTVGVDFFARLVTVNDGTSIKLQLWDTAGQERFRSITKSYYRNSVGALLVYDICNRESYKHISGWMLEARRHIEPYKAVFLLVGCKLDLASANGDRAREVTTEEARTFAEAHGIAFAETSAKTGFNVEQAFSDLTQIVYNKIKSGEYQLEDGWDGIKKGYFSASGASRLASGAGGAVSLNNNGGPSFRPLAMGEPANRRCC